MWPGVNGINDSPVSCWVCRKISCVCNWTRLCLTVPKMTEGLSCAQWSAVRCSDWRRGSLGATLVAVPWKRHEVTLQNDTARGEGKKNELHIQERGLTLAGSWPEASAGAIRTHCTSFSRWRSSQWSTCCWSTPGDRNVTWMFQSQGLKHHSPHFFYSRAGRFHSLCRHAKSRSSVCAGPGPRRLRPAAWMETAGETLELNAL